MAEELDLKIIDLHTRVVVVEERLTSQDEQLMGAIDPSTKRFRPGLAQDVIDLRGSVDGLRNEITLGRRSVEGFVTFARVFLLRSLGAIATVIAGILGIMGYVGYYVATHLHQLSDAAAALSH